MCNEFALERECCDIMHFGSKLQLIMCEKKANSNKGIDQGTREDIPVSLGMLQMRILDPGTCSWSSGRNLPCWPVF